MGGGSQGNRKTKRTLLDGTTEVRTAFNDSSPLSYALGSRCCSCAPLQRLWLCISPGDGIPRVPQPLARFKKVASMVRVMCYICLAWKTDAMMHLTVYTEQSDQQRRDQKRNKLEDSRRAMRPFNKLAFRTQVVVSMTATERQRGAVACPHMRAAAVAAGLGHHEQVTARHLGQVAIKADFQ